MEEVTVWMHKRWYQHEAACRMTSRTRGLLAVISSKKLSQPCICTVRLLSLQGTPSVLTLHSISTLQPPVPWRFCLLLGANQLTSSSIAFSIAGTGHVTNQPCFAFHWMTSELWETLGCTTFPTVTSTTFITLSKFSKLFLQWSSP